MARVLREALLYFHKATFRGPIILVLFLVANSRGSLGVHHGGPGSVKLVFTYD